MAVGDVHTSTVTFGGGDTVNNTLNRDKLTTIVQTNANRPDLSLPTASKGQIVPYVIGRFRITNPNFIWYGNVKNIVEVVKSEKTQTTEKLIQVRSFGGDPSMINSPEEIPVESDLVKIAKGALDGDWWLQSVLKVYETETIVTYTRSVVGYTVDAAIGICLGPDVELLAIYNGKKRIWSGEATGRFTYAGDGKKNSILQNGFIYRGGQFDQTPEPYLRGGQRVPAGDLPGYVGIAYIVLRTVDSALLMGADLHFEVRRLPNPLALPDNVNVIKSNDINPATFVADVLLNDWGGVGINPDWIDVDNFKLAAQRYFTEHIGMSVAVAQENFGISMIREMQQQTNSIVYADPSTSLMRIKPMRADPYEETGLYELTPKTGSSIQRMDKSAFLAMPTHFAMKYYDRSSNYENVVVTNRNPGVPPGENRARRLANLDFGAVCSNGIAEAVYDLLMSTVAVPRLSMSVLADRNAADLVPGDLFLVTWPLYSMVKFPVTVRKVREQDKGSNSLVIECEQYARPNVKKFFKPAEPTKHVAPDLGSYKPTAAMVQGVTWWMVVRSGYNVNPNYPVGDDFPLFLISMANESQLGFDIYNTANDAKLLTYAEPPLSARLLSPISKLDGHVDWIIPELKIGQVVNSDILANVGLTGVQTGVRLVFINNEILAFESFTDNGDGTFSLINVYRGLLDTIAHNHAKNDTVYVLDITKLPLSGKGHKYTFEYDYAAVSHAHKGRGAYPADAFALPTFVAEGRLDCPLRPQAVKINNTRTTAAIPLAINEPASASWVSRSRMPKKIALANDGQFHNNEIMSGYRRQAHQIELVDSVGTEFIVGDTILGDTGSVLNNFDQNFLEFMVPAGAAPGVGILRVRCVLGTYNPATPGTPPVFDIYAYQVEEIAVYIIPEGAIVADFLYDNEVL